MTTAISELMVRRETLEHNADVAREESDALYAKAAEISEAIRILENAGVITGAFDPATDTLVVRYIRDSGFKRTSSPAFASSWGCGSVDD